MLLREVRWLVLGVLSLYVALILFGYDKADPGWSHASEVARVSNPGGRFGAWLADVLFYLFGASAWWWVVFLGHGLLYGIRRLREELRADEHHFAFTVAGFVIVLFASCALEHLRFYSNSAALPLAPGGLFGLEIGGAVRKWFGFTGSTLILLAAIAGGLSIFTGLSLLGLSERIGLALENLWLGLTRLAGGVRMPSAPGPAAAAEPVASLLAQDPPAATEAPKRRRKPEPPPETERVEPGLSEAPLLPDDDAPVAPPRGEPQPVLREPAVRNEPPRAAPLEPQRPVVRERASVRLAEGDGPLPPLELLDRPAANSEPPPRENLEMISRLIERKLADFGVEVQVLAAYPGPVITRYEIEPATGVKGSQVVNLAKDLARSLSLISIRVVETVPGKSCMALELPNPTRQMVRLSEIIGSRAYHDMSSPLTVVLGKDIGGQPVVADLAKMPHLLVAGTTGSGKSVGINAMILSLLYKSEPDKVRLIMVDPKMLELSIYEGIPHLLAPVVTDMKHAANALNWCVGEMDRRYKLMAAVGVRNLAGYNKAVSEARAAERPLTNPFSISPENPEPLEPLPHIVVVVDELADLMMVVGKKVEELIARLAQKARAAGIHLILATQRPSVDVITGLIKANVPTRIAFQVSSKIDSRTILDQMGAETLLGMGDMLYLPPGTGLPVRVHGAFVADEEVHKVVDYLKQTGAPDYVEGILSGGADEGGGAAGLDGEDADGEADPLYDQAVEVVLKTRRPSISLVQRHLRIGYNRSARLIEQMERAGIVSSMGPTGNREVLVPAREGD